LGNKKGQNNILSFLLKGMGIGKGDGEIRNVIG
jgi:hypothetical protein